MTTKAFWSVFAVTAALTFTLVASAFEKSDNSAAEMMEGKVFYAPTYFHFIGSPGQEEDVEKWQQISEEDYELIYGACNNANDGCRLKTDSVQTISGVIRPKLVEVNISGLHKNPKTSLLSGVTAVGNQNP